MKAVALAALVLGAARANTADAAIVTLKCVDHVTTTTSSGGQTTTRSDGWIKTLSIDLESKQFCSGCKVWRDIQAYDEKTILLIKAIFPPSKPEYETFSMQYIDRQSGVLHEIVKYGDGHSEQETFNCSAPKI